MHPMMVGLMLMLPSMEGVMPLAQWVSNYFLNDKYVIIKNQIFAQNQQRQ
jgi:hypothetical protein